MATGSGSNNVDKGKQVANEPNVKSPDDNRNENVSNCSICQETLINKDDDRTHVTLRCGHDFHLDCIGSAFNAKKTMQCPNCRTIELGQWHIPIDCPTPVFIPVGWTPEELVIPLGFGMELCPFGGSGHLNPSRGPILCPYFDYSLTIPQYLALSSVAVLPNLNSHLTIGSGIVHNPHGLQVDYRTNPFWLTQLSSVPTNPRYFRSVYNPEVIISRHYFTHESFDYRFYSSVNNALVVPPYLGGIPVVDALVVPPNLGGIAAVDALVVPPNLSGISAVDVDGLVAPPNLGGISAVDASVVPPYLGRVSAVNVSVVSTYQDSSSIATVSVAPFGQISSSLANAHVIPPYSDGNSVADVPVVPPSQHGSDGDNDRGGQSGGIHEKHDCGQS